jgi:acetyltransferase-like isoleucine patch superfamily enzyme
MRETPHAALKSTARLVATALVSPALLSYRISAALIGRDRALQNATQGLALLPGLTGQYLRVAFWSAALIGRDRALQNATQGLALLPGLTGQYLRVAFLAHALEYCHPSVTVEFGTCFSKAGARLEENVYIGPMCQIGLAHVGRDALLAAGVHVPSGARMHGIDDPDRPIRDQPGRVTAVRIGAGSWIGSGAIVMADVGRGTVVGAGSVVTRSLPDGVIAAGIPARVRRSRAGGPGPCSLLANGSPRADV